MRYVRIYLFFCLFFVVPAGVLAQKKGKKTDKKNTATDFKGSKGTRVKQTKRKRSPSGKFIGEQASSAKKRRRKRTKTNLPQSTKRSTARATKKGAPLFTGHKDIRVQQPRKEKRGKKGDKNHTATDFKGSKDTRVKQTKRKRSLSGKFIGEQAFSVKKRRRKRTKTNLPQSIKRSTARTTKKGPPLFTGHKDIRVQQPRTQKRGKKSSKNHTATAFKGSKDTRVEQTKRKRSLSGKFIGDQTLSVKKLHSRHTKNKHSPSGKFIGDRTFSVKKLHGRRKKVDTQHLLTVKQKKNIHTPQDEQLLSTKKVPSSWGLTVNKYLHALEAALFPKSTHIPPGVRNPPKKPTYDKKERKIWFD